MTEAKEHGGKVATSVDVARLAGVSRSAVSRAFTPGASVAPETREKVVAAAKSLGYRVNYLARSLSNQRSDLVGLVVAGMDNPYRVMQVDALARALLDANFRPVLLPTGDGRDTARVIDQLLHYNVSGVIVTSDAPPSEICQECAASNVPVVLINKGDEIPLVDRVMSDNDGAAVIGLDALLAAGCQRPAVAASPTRSFSGQRRRESFLALSARKGIQPRALDCEVNDYANGDLVADQLVGAMADVDGLFCVNDYLAIGIIDGLRRRNALSRLETLALIGHDNVPQAAWFAYDLTTIEQPVAIQSRQAVHLLTQRMRKPRHAASTEITPVHLVERGSSLRQKAPNAEKARL